MERFILGERRYISWEVKARDSKAEFIIRDCTWTLYKHGEIESQGTGEIDGHTIHVLIEPKEALRYYNLVVTYTIANQELKTALQIEVIKP